MNKIKDQKLTQFSTDLGDLNPSNMKLKDFLILSELYGNEWKMDIEKRVMEPINRQIRVS